MIFTVVTVVFNDEYRIEKTLKSVLEQSYAKIEYIVVDGFSSDNTLSILKKYEDKISHIISEPDRGIYDAMNKGLKYSKGDYVIFLNAGDEFINSGILYEVSKIIEINNCELYYGSVTTNQQKIISPKPIFEIYKNMVFNHQACFFNVRTHKKYLYDLEYQIAADYDLVLRMFVSGERIRVLDLIITVIEIGGVADMNRVKTFKEYYMIRRGKIPFYMNFGILSFNLMRMIAALVVKKILYVLK